MEFRALKSIWKLFFVIFTILLIPLLRNSQDSGSLPLANDISLPNFVALEKVAQNKYTEFVANIRINKPDRLANVEKISLKFGTYFKTVEILEAELVQVASGCRYRLMQPVTLPDGGFLDFAPLACAWDKSSSFTLNIRGKDLEGLAVLGYEGLSETLANPQILALAPGGSSMAIAGRFLAKIGQTPWYVPRARLLAYMWNWKSSWVDFTALLILSLSVVAFTLSVLLSQAWFARKNRTYAGIILSFLLILGLQTAYSVLSPPFLAPDEPDHFLTFSKMGGLARAEHEGLILSNNSHFDRLMCHVDEKFTKSDMNKPMEQTQWNPFHVGYVDMPPRSAVATFVWLGVARTFFTSQSSPESVLLGLRLFNGCYFSLIFLMTALVYCRSQDIGPVDFLLGLCLIPTLFHFSNHNSNHAFIISHYLPLILGYRLLITGRALSWLAYAWLGLNIGLCLLSGRLGMIFLLVAYASFFIRWIWLGTLQTRPDIKALRWAVAQFCLAALFCLLAIVLFRESAYVQIQIPYVMNSSGIAGNVNLLFLTAVLFGPPAGFLIGYVLAKLWKNQLFTQVMRIIFGLAAVTMLFILFFPLFKSIPPLLNIEYLNPPLTGAQYAGKVVKHLLLTSGWGGQDFYLIESFWGGFGCPEPVVGNLFVQGIKGGLGSFLTLGFIWSVRKNEWRLSLTILLSLALLLINITMLSFGSASQASNLHGRYMVGFYLLLIQTAFLAFHFYQDEKAKRLYETLCLAAISLVQIASVWYLVGRYF